MNKIKKMNAESERYKFVWKEIKAPMKLRDQDDPFVETDPEDALPDARREPFSGVWYGHEEGEEIANYGCFGGKS